MIKYIINDKLRHEWDFDKNQISIDDAQRSKKFWWKCQNGHSFYKTIGYRVKYNCQCPYCSGREATKDNNLLIKFPGLCKEWDYDKNELLPENILPKSAKKVWWKCSKGHSWQTMVYERTDKSHSCPICNAYMKTSFGEQSIYYYLKDYNPINRYKYQNKEIDIYLPNENIGIEFNGLYWHKNKNDKDKQKESFLIANGMRMFYICESLENKIENNKIYFDCKHKYNDNLEWSIKELFKLLNFNIDVNIKYDLYLINKNINKKISNNLLINHPELVKEWDYDKNILKPDEVSNKANIKVWWKCIKGHSWQAYISNRTDKNTDCPYCSGYKVLKGFNDLQTLFPVLVQEWDYEKNIVKPNGILSTLHKKVWWKCSKGHSWETYIFNRTSKNTNCPYCMNQKVLKGFNDLQTLFPEISQEWDYYKNVIKPDEVMSKSHKKVWWKCTKNHSWQAYIYNRTKQNGTGCPYCNKNRK